MQKRVDEAPDGPAVTFEGLRLHEMPAEGDEDCTRETLPLKPLAWVTEIVDVAGEPATAEIDAGLAVTAKSVI